MSRASTLVGNLTQQVALLICAYGRMPFQGILGRCADPEMLPAECGSCGGPKMKTPCLPDEGASSFGTLGSSFLLGF